MKKPERASENLNGVECNVKNCHYNSQNYSCMAPKIKIQPHIVNSAHTDCATFTMK